MEPPLLPADDASAPDEPRPDPDPAPADAPAPPAGDAGHPELTTLLIVFFAFGCGLGVANMNYAQPLLTKVQDDFGVGETGAGMLVTVTQVGYALGILFILPAADFLEKRRLICIVLVVAAGFMIAIVFSTSYIVTLAAFFCLGVTSVTPQLLIPMAAQMAKPERRGRVVGGIVSGIVIGVLISRVFSGLLGNAFNWRTIYWVAAIPMVLFAVAMRLLLPEVRNRDDLTYGQALKSLIPLFLKYGKLRYAGSGAMCCFGSLNVFWTCLAYLLRDSYGWGPDIAGLFGLVGVAGALMALFAGRLADSKGAFFVVSIGIALLLVGYVMVATVCWWLAGLIITVLVIDAGVQYWSTGLQTIVQNLTDEARSRVTAIFQFMFFAGASIGSAVGAALYQHYGWIADGLFGVAVIVCALVIHLVTQWGEWRAPPPGQAAATKEEEEVSEIQRGMLDEAQPV
jgi:predicted MFS family arabinose efflux permease